MAKKKKEIVIKKAAVKKQVQAKTSVKKETKKKVMKEKKLQKVETKKSVPEKTATKKSKQVKVPPVQVVMQKNHSNQSMSAGTGKKRLMVSYEKLPHDVVDVIRNKYPYGYNHDLKEVKGIDNKKFYVLPIELPDVVYLVKVDIRKPFKIQDADEEEDIFTPEEEFASEEDNFPAEDLEQMDADDEGAEDEKKKKKKRDEDDDNE